MTMKTSNYKWIICGLLFFATTVNYLDRQVLSLTYPNLIEKEFHWDETMYGTITSMFSMVYAIAMFFAGKLIDWLGSKKGYLWAIGIWSTGACLHAVCGIGTEMVLGIDDLKSPEMLQLAAGSKMALAIGTVSVWMFLSARCLLAIGESGNFPAAIKVTAEYFEPKDRAFATSIFNSGCSIGALIAPFAIPLIAKYWGWEMAFIVIGALGYVWMGLWILLYRKPEETSTDNFQSASLQDGGEGGLPSTDNQQPLSYLQALKMRETWALSLCRFVSDGGWWFFLFWTPMYINTQFNIKPTDTEGMTLIFVLYLITMLSIFGGKLPNLFIRRGKTAYESHLWSMFVFACVPLLGLFAQPAGEYFSTPWAPIIIIGILGAAHQSWSANMFSVIGDRFPKSSAATITGISGTVGGFCNAWLNLAAGYIIVFADETNLSIFGFEGKPSGYMILFCWCGIAYLLGWTILKLLMPKEA